MSMPLMTPDQRYQQDLKQADFSYDVAQEKAVLQLQLLFNELVKPVSRNLISQLLTSIGIAETKPIRGLYFWGGVGRGKTYLMDAFYDCPLNQNVNHGIHKRTRPAIDYQTLLVALRV